MEVSVRKFTEKVAEGKTKRIYRSQHEPILCRVVSKSDTTAGDGKRHEVIPHKGHLVNEVACNVFELLRRDKIPIAYLHRCDALSFVAVLCRMVKLEIVVRFEVDEEGSYKKRNPDIPSGHRFSKPIIEFFLKTTGRKWGDWDLPCDDPLLVQEGDDHFGVYLPDVPLSKQEPLFHVRIEELGLKGGDRTVARWLAECAASALDTAWKSVRARLIDFKMEVGFTPDGDLVIADLISSDEWRLVTDISKQGFRKGDPPDVVLAKYNLALVLSRHFPQES